MGDLWKAVLILVPVVLLGLVGSVFLIDRSMQSQGPIPVGTDDSTVTVGGVRIRYRTFRTDSAGPTLVLLHGFASSLESWRALAPELTCGSVVALDLPGFGGSGRPDISYDLDNQSRFLTGFLDRLGIRRAVLVGQSMGSSLAIWEAAHHPDRVSRLALFAPSGLEGSLHYDGLHGALVRPGPINAWARFVVRVPGVRRLLSYSLAQQGLTVATSYDQRFEDAIRRVSQPTLLIWSHGDPRVPFGNASRYLELMRNAEVMALRADAGHAGPFFRPDSVAKSICRFLDGGNVGESEGSQSANEAQRALDDAWVGNGSGRESSPARGREARSANGRADL